MRALGFPTFYDPFFSSGIPGLLGSLSSFDSPAPDYNLERTSDDGYRISLSVAGFSLSDLSIEAKGNLLTVSGDRSTTSSESSDSTDDGTDDSTEILVRGIPSGSFTRRFRLADHIEVVEARLDSGILSIDLVRNLPESLRSRRISITDSSVVSDEAA